MANPSTTRVAYQHLLREANVKAISRRMVKTAYLEVSDEAKAIVAQSLATLLGLLRAQSFSYQTSHWQAGGLTSYGNHLLFDRLYHSTLHQVDQLAEKMVGYLGAEAVASSSAVEVMSAWVNEWAKIECPFSRGLKSEKDFQQVTKQAYDTIKASGGMTLGLDDWLMALASAHDETTFLLQQTQATPNASPHE